MSPDLTEVSTHYEFGANWRDYAKKIDDRAIETARTGLLKLIPEDAIRGRTFIDIGSGSGLHSLAALQMGARSVTAIDIDPDSVETTRATLASHWPQGNYDVQLASVLDLQTRKLGSFDIVYSWGVLHHTGAMWRAIECATEHVGSNGQFILAIYRKTPFCWAWKIEKRIFTNAGNKIRGAIRMLFIGSFRLGLRLTGRDPNAYERNYFQLRGMSFANDVDDWLGGYPYESATEAEIISFMNAKGFNLEAEFPFPPKLGLSGTGCSEFRFRRRA